MTFDSIELFFQDPPRTHLTCEQAICYIVWRLLQGEVYFSGLIQEVEGSSNVYRLSDTVTLAALRYLEGSTLVESTWMKTPGRGRPRRVYQLLPEVREIAQEYVDLWLRSPYAVAIHPDCKSSC